MFGPQDAEFQNQLCPGRTEALLVICGRFRRAAIDRQLFRTLHAASRAANLEAVLLLGTSCPHPWAGAGTARPRKGEGGLPSYGVWGAAVGPGVGGGVGRGDWFA